MSDGQAPDAGQDVRLSVNGQGKKEAPGRRVEPHVPLAHVMEFLLSLWVKENDPPPGTRGKVYKLYPERIELWTGRNRKGKLDRMSPVRVPFHSFKANGAEPTREEHAAMANQLAYVAQQHCNALHRTQLYLAVAYQFGSGDDMIGCCPIRREPDNGPSATASDMDDPFGIDGADDAIGAGPQAMMFRTWLAMMAQAHEHTRFALQAGMQAIDRANQRLSEDNALLRGAVHGAFDQQLASYKAMQQLYDGDAERKVKLRYAEVGAGALEQTSNLIFAMLPGAINRIAGKEIVQVSPKSVESAVLADFLQSVSDDEAKAAFGYQGDSAPRLSPPECIFTREQSNLLAAIAAQHAPPDQIDRLLHGGDLEITLDQMGRAKSLFGQKLSAVERAIAQRMAAKAMQGASPQ